MIYSQIVLNCKYYCYGMWGGYITYLYKLRNT